jgi:hypothetical protein
MALEVVHQGGDGTTVPYGPLFDGIRKNRGFVDARGRPDIAASIAEGSESAALRKLLIRVSEENVYFSLGCDLGMHPEPEAKVTLRQVAGGYIQVVGMDYELLSTDDYDNLTSISSADCAQNLKAAVGEYGSRAAMLISNFRISHL